MLYDLSNEYQVSEFKEAVKKHLEQGHFVELKRKFPQRSLKQNSLLHVWIGYFACEYGCTFDECKVDIYKRHCNKDIFEREVTNKRGNKVKILRSSADLSTEEMARSMERFRNFAATGGIFLPPPGNTEFIKYCLREIERNKYFV